MAFSADNDFDGFPGLRSDWLGSERDPFAGIRVPDDAAVEATAGNKTELDLGMLWKMIEERHNKTMKHAQNNTWELVVIQAVLLSLLVVVSLLWAFCCKKKCIGEQPLMTELVSLSGHVVAFARKISTGSNKDLPPSYSRIDLTTVGLTIHDHLNPPPTYETALVHTHFPVRRHSSSSSIPPIIGVLTNPAGNDGTPRRHSHIFFHETSRTLTSQSLPPALLTYAREIADDRRRSILSEGDASSRRVSFADEATVGHCMISRVDSIQEEESDPRVDQLEPVLESEELNDVAREETAV